MQDEFKYYKLALVAVLSCIVGAVLAGSMEVFRDTGGVWLGAIGTLLTLIFLIFQNIKLQKAQEKRDEEDSRIKKTQYLENRKKNFYSLLEEFKNETAIPIEFTSKYSLYKKIYPSSKVNSENYYEPSSAFVSHLQRLFIDLQHKLNVLHSNEVTQKHVRELFNSMANFQYLLNFQLIGTNLVRNNINQTNIANLFYFENTLETYSQVYSMICETCSVQSNTPLFSSQGMEPIYRLESVVFSTWSLLYDMNVPKYAIRKIICLHKLYKMAYDFEERNDTFEYDFLINLMHLFATENIFWHVVGNKVELLKELEIHIRGIQEILSDVKYNFPNHYPKLIDLKEKLEKEGEALHQEIENDISQNN